MGYPGTGDWFDGTNWDTGLIPTNADNAFVNRMGGVSSSIAEINAPGATAQGLTIGFSDGLTGGSGGGGRVNVNTPRLDIDRDLVIGKIRGLGNGGFMGILDASDGVTVGRDYIVGLLDGGAPGSIVGGGVVIDGTLNIGRDLTAGFFEAGAATSAAGANVMVRGGINMPAGRAVDIGVSNDVGNANGSVIDTSGTGMIVASTALIGDVHSAGDATGLLEIGSLDVGGDLRVGNAFSSGSADGTVEVFGTVSAQEVFVGVSDLGDTGGATGRLILHDNMIATSIQVGRNLSGTGGAAIGEIMLDKAIINVDSIQLGEGSDVLFHIDEFEYGAIHANLDVDLFGQRDESMGRAMFNFIPTAGTHHYDLVTGLDIGFTGTFSGFDVLGLDAGFMWSTAHVFDNSFEIFRLTITGTPVGPGPGAGAGAGPGGAGPGGNGAVPEPMTAMLGLIGLGVLGMATRRRV